MFVHEFIKTEDFSSNTVQKQDLLQKIKICDVNDSFEQNQAEDLVIGPSELANDIYSVKMIENFAEHTREVKIKVFDVDNEENACNHRNETLAKINENDPVENKTSAIIFGSNDSQTTSRHFENESSVGELQTEGRTLQSKIRQIEQENRRKKKKEKKKIATSFDSRQKLLMSSGGKLDKLEKNLKNINRNKLGHKEKKTKVSRGTLKRNTSEVLVQKNRNYHQKSVDEKVAEKNCMNKKRRASKGQIEVSNENIFTQPLLTHVRKVNKPNQEPENLATSESIFTGIDAHELSKNNKGMYQSDHNTFQYPNHNTFKYPNDFNGNNNFGKFYEVCNMNVFDWFTSNKRTFTNHTPLNPCNISVTPIKLRRKNRRQEIKRLLKKRREGLDKNKVRQNGSRDRNKLPKYATFDHADQRKEKLIQCGGRHNENPKTDGKTKHSSTLHETEGLNEEDVYLENCSNEFRSDAREETHTVYYDALESEINCDIGDALHNKTTSGGHVFDSYRTNGEAFRNDPLARMSSEGDISEVYSKKHLKTKTNRNFYKETPKQQILGKSINFHRKHRVEKQNSIYKKVMHENETAGFSEILKPHDQMCHECDEVDMLNTHINDVLSRRYRTTLQLESQKILEEDYPINAHVSNSNNYEEVNQTGWMSPKKIRCTIPDDMNHQNETNLEHFDVCERNRRTQLLKSIDGVSDISQTIIEDIWENSIIPDEIITSEPSALPKPLGKRIRDREVFETFSKQDLNTNVLLSPYFKGLKSGFFLENDDFLSKNKRSILETDISVEGNASLKLFVAKHQKSYLDSTFFRKKFSLTPVLQSSNSNPYHNSEIRLDAHLKNNVDTRSNDSMLGTQNAKRLQYQNSLGKQYAHEEKSLHDLCKKHANKSDPFSRNLTEKDHFEFETIQCGEDIRFDDIHETTMKKTNHSPMPSNKNVTTCDWPGKTTVKSLNDKRSKTKSSCAQTILDMEDIALLDTQVVDHNVTGSYQADGNQAPQITFNNKTNNIERITANRNGNEEHQITNPTDHDNCNESRNSFKMDYVENWLTTLPESPVPCENISNTLQKNKQIPNNEEPDDISKDKQNSLEFNALTSNREMDDTEENFETYMNNEITKPNNLDDRSDNLYDYQQNLTHEFTNVKSPRVSYDNENHLAYEAKASPHDQPGETTLKKCIALANTKIIENNDIPAETRDDISTFFDNETNQVVNGGNFVFNSLGLVSERVPIPLATEGTFQLKDRYGFMDKGMSPLVLANNNAADVGQLEGSELLDMENIMPTPGANSLDNNCIHKIVSMEEILVKTHLKSSIINSVCHVTKDLLNVTFKVRFRWSFRISIKKYSG